MPHSQRAWQLIRSRQSRSRNDRRFRERVHRYGIQVPQTGKIVVRVAGVRLRGTTRTKGMRRKLERLTRLLPDALLEGLDATVGKAAVDLVERLPVATGFTAATVDLSYEADRKRVRGEVHVQSPYADTLPEVRSAGVQQGKARRVLEGEVRRAARKAGRR